jgi:hypothetical protein
MSAREDMFIAFPGIFERDDLAAALVERHQSSISLKSDQPSSPVPSRAGHASTPMIETILTSTILVRATAGRPD